MADKKKMSVEEVLAACRGGSGGAPAPADSAAAQEPAAESPPAKPKAAAPANPAVVAAKPGTMSTADILAAARGAKAAAPASEASPAPEKPAAGKPAIKPGSASTADILAMARGAKPAAAAPAAETPKKAPAPKPVAAAKDSSTPKPAAAEKKAGGPIDTASILAAARSGTKPGPISKAELAAREQAAPTEKSKKKAETPPMPEKPAYAQPRTAAATAQPSRRGFIQGTLAAISGSALALGFSSLAVTFNLWGLGLARFMFPNILTEPPTKFKVGFPNELGQGQVQTKFVPQFGVWIVRHEYDGAAQIYALQTVCTHLGCTPNWLEGEQKFKCPCHGSGFYKDGVNFEGPAPRPLERFAIRMADDGQLEVDKSRKFKEELGQWRDTACFVPV